MLPKKELMKKMNAAIYKDADNHTTTTLHFD